MGTRRSSPWMLALVASLSACGLSHPIAGPNAVPDTGLTDAEDIEAPRDVADVIDAPELPDVVDVPERDAPDVVEDDIVDAGDDVADAGDVPEPIDVADAGDVPEPMDVVDAPDVRDAPDVVDAPDAIDAPDVRDAPDVIDAPDVRDAPDVIDAPDVRDAPDVVDAPDAPDAGGPITQGVAAGDGCMNAPAMNATNGWWRYTGRTTGAVDDLRASCAVDQTAQPDVVWRLVLPARRRVSFALRATSTWNPVLTVIDGDCSRRAVDPARAVAEREVACVDDTPGQGGAATPSMVLPAGTWFVVVDGNGSNGSFTLDLRIEDAPADGGPDPISTLEGACPAVPANAARVSLRDDEGSAPVALGFGFPLYGQSFGRLAISSNGFVQLLRDGEAPTGLDTYANAVIPNDAAPNAIVAPYWDDLDPAMVPDRVRWWTTTGPRAIHVRWVDIPRWLETDQRVTVDLRLEESGWIQFRYCDLTPTTAGSRSLGVSATAGIESADGRRGYLYSLWQPFVLARRQLRFAPR